MQIGHGKNMIDVGPLFSRYTQAKYIFLGPDIYHFLILIVSLLGPLTETMN
jgi:hypothetical protein